MKKFTAIFVIMVLALVLMFNSCGNKALFDTTYKFNYAIVEFPGGNVEKINIKNWTDYEDGEQIQITASDGTTYLVHAANCVLVAED
jgi:hypothetical protein